MLANPSRFRALYLVALPALALPVMVATSSARADVRVSGHASAGVHIGGSVSYGHGPGYYDHGYATPPPPPCTQCAHPPATIPAYNVEYQNPAPPLAPINTEPTVGIGLFGGGMTVDETDFSGGGFLARIRLADGVQIEGELGGVRRAEIEDAPEHHVAGISLLWDVFDCGDIDGYGALGAGGIHTEHAEEGVGFVEVGFGVDWRLTEHLYLGADLRFGGMGRSETGDVALLGAGDLGAPVDDDHEAIGYSRGRLFGMVYF